jgi:hypothetical protein
VKRAGVLWFLACLAALIVVFAASASCRRTIARGEGEDCSGFSDFAYTNSGLHVGIIVVAVLGALLIPADRATPVQSALPAVRRAR